MRFDLISCGLALFAGSLSTLSPCVLAIVPILLSSALNAHRRAPLALAGTALQMNSDVVRRTGAALLALFALIILSGRLQQRFAAATSGIGMAGGGLVGASSSERDLRAARHWPCAWDDLESLRRPNSRCGGRSG
jgi:cytochrome c-type biogenesis protein